MLRERKRRPTKPLAVMVPDDAALYEVARPTVAEALLLTSEARPIVLVRCAGTLPAVVSPGTSRVGVFLPYTPLHHLLLAELARPLIVTSGNRCDEPMVVDNDAALVTLAGIADGFLMSDRDIAVRYDDSVVQVIASRPRIVRRARGYAPTALALPVPARRPLLGVGAELKHTFTLASEGARGNRSAFGGSRGRRVVRFVRAHIESLGAAGEDRTANRRARPASWLSVDAIRAALPGWRPDARTAPSRAHSSVRRGVRHYRTCDRHRI